MSSREGQVCSEEAGKPSCVCFFEATMVVGVILNMTNASRWCATVSAAIYAGCSSLRAAAGLAFYHQPMGQRHHSLDNFFSPRLLHRSDFCMRSKIEFKWGIRTLAEEGHATASAGLHGDNARAPSWCRTVAARRQIGEYCDVGVVGVPNVSCLPFDELSGVRDACPGPFSPPSAALVLLRQALC
jgi:hypothetical protein